MTELQRLHQLKDDFLSTVSHELRTPIASMKMVIQLLTTLTHQGETFLTQLADHANQRDKVMQYLTILREQCDREWSLIEDLLNLKSIEAGIFAQQPAPINCQVLLTSLIASFEARIHRQGQVLQVHIADNLPSLYYDPLLLKRIVVELLTNACKYTPKGETITITARLVPRMPTAVAPSPPPCLQITIANTGVEIPATEMERIFDKFYRIPHHDPWKQGGTGLGLALVKKMVEQMGEMLQVTSADNQTCFTVCLSV